MTTEITKTQQTTRHLRCILTEKEILEVGKQSAELTRAIIALEDDKARISKDFGARIAEKEAQRSVLTDKIISGYEFRDVMCSVLLNVPAVGQKQIRRDDTMEQVAVEMMTPDEMQERLPFDDPPRVVAEPVGCEDEVADDAVLDALLTSPHGDAFSKAVESANLPTVRVALLKLDGSPRWKARVLVRREKDLLAGKRQQEA